MEPLQNPNENPEGKHDQVNKHFQLRTVVACVQYQSSKTGKLHAGYYLNLLKFEIT